MVFYSFKVGPHLITEEWIRMFKFLRNLISVRHLNVSVRMHGILPLVNLEGGCFVLFPFWKKLFSYFYFLWFFGKCNSYTYFIRLSIHARIYVPVGLSTSLPLSQLLSDFLKLQRYMYSEDQWSPAATEYCIRSAMAVFKVLYHASQT